MSTSDDHERLRARLAAIVESSDDPIVSKNLDGIVETWNPAAERLFGWRADEMVGESLLRIVPEERRDEEHEILARLCRGERIEHLVTERVAKDGERIPVRLSVSPIRDATGRVIGASKIVRDLRTERRAEADARASRRTLEAVIDAAPVAISVLDAHGRVELWNAAAESIFGWRRDEVLGGRPPVVPEERADEYRTHVRQTLEGEALEGKETTRHRRDGTPLDVVLWSSPIPNGEAPRLVSITADITEKKSAERALQRSEERFRTLADNIAQFAWMTDESGSIVWYNRRWFEYTGTTLDEVRGWGWTKVHHPDHVDRVVTHIRDAFERGVEWEDTFPLRGADGRYRWFLSRAVPIRDDDGNVVRWLGTNTDITDRMALEAALREADERKDQFIATLAHELRNPLAPIRTGLDLLREAGDDDATRAKVLPTLERQTTQLVRLVDDLLDVSRITRGKVELRPEHVDLSDVVDQAIETSRPAIDEGGHTLAVDVPAGIVLRADPTRLAQVVSNLLNNAVRYSEAPGRIEIRAQRRDGGVALSVADEGIGIAPDRLDGVFELFGQGPSPSAGLGIGLTLVRSLVEMHDGSVTVHSEGEGKGSTFTVWLPTVDRAADTPDVAREPATVEPLRLLLADDNVDAADTLGAVLRRRGHDVRVVYGGEEALRAAAETPFDAIVLDLGMPEVDGFEVAERLRAEPALTATPLIALTGWGQATARRRAREAGFDHHLVKPAEAAAIERLARARPGAKGAPHLERE